MAAELRFLQLYRDLRGVHFDPQEKPSPSENLTDILEILAVARGIKPTHLNGHVFRSERLLVELEGVARVHGLRTRRARRHPPSWHREPNVEKEYLEWERERSRNEAARSPGVLWIYRDPAIEPRIAQLMAGEGEEAAILGYPPCCVTAHCEISARMIESAVAGYKRRHSAKTSEDLIRCTRQGLGVSIDPPIYVPAEESKRRFPFVQFTACQPCIDQPGSPATECNERMRQLAAEVDGHFASQIERAVADELAMVERQRSGPATMAHVQRSLPRLNTSPTARVGRNDLCPCGSGQKFKKCHGRRT